MRRRCSWQAGLILLPLLLSGCESLWQPSQSGRWISPVHQDHPLAGRVWAPSDGRFATAGEVYAALQDADFVLVGEKHNNADHHRYQALVIREMHAQNRRPAIVFEMLTAGQQAALDAHLAAKPYDSAGLGKAVGWDARGWPRWTMYRPIGDAALAAGAPLLAGGLERKTTRAVASQGVAALGEAQARRLRLDEPIDAAMRERMHREIHDSHCGQMPESMLDPMVTVTLAKDAVMAEAMIRGRTMAGRDSALLIAGNGHVRADWGVPWHLRKLAPGRRIVAIGVLEVVAGETDAAAYVAGSGGALPFDFVWFTPRVDDNDPCEVFADQLQRIKAPNPAGTGSGAD